MASSRSRGIIGIFIAGSLVFSSTGAAATSMPQPVSPWATLAGLSGGAPTAALCGAAVVSQAPAGGCVLPVTDAPVPVAQAAPPPPLPVPPVAPPSSGFGFSPILLALVAVAAGVGIYFLVKHHHNSNSPA